MVHNTLVLFLLLTPDWSVSLKCFLCSESGQRKYKCPTDSDSRTIYENLQNQYIDIGEDDPTTGCSLQIGYDDEVVYQGTMSAKDCKEKKSIFLQRTKNFTCCFGCDGCNWSLGTAFRSDCVGQPVEPTTKSPSTGNTNTNSGGSGSSSSGSSGSSGKETSESSSSSSKSSLTEEDGLDYKLASLILLISTVILSLILIVICGIYFLCSDSSSPRSPMAYPSGTSVSQLHANVTPSNHFVHKDNSFD